MTNSNDISSLMLPLFETYNNDMSSLYPNFGCQFFPRLSGDIFSRLYNNDMKAIATTCCRYSHILGGNFSRGSSLRYFGLYIVTTFLICTNDSVAIIDALVLTPNPRTTTHFFISKPLIPTFSSPGFTRCQPLESIFSSL